MGSQDNTVGILTRQWVGQLRNHNTSPSKGKRIFLLQSIKSCCTAGSTSYSVSNGEPFYSNTSGQSMKQTTHSHLVLTLRMYGAIPPLPLCLCGMHRDNLIFHMLQELFLHSSTLYEPYTTTANTNVLQQRFLYGE